MSWSCWRSGCRTKRLPNRKGTPEKHLPEAHGQHPPTGDYQSQNPGYSHQRLVKKMGDGVTRGQEVQSLESSNFPPWTTLICSVTGKFLSPIYTTNPLKKNIVISIFQGNFIRLCQNTPLLVGAERSYHPAGQRGVPPFLFRWSFPRETGMSASLQQMSGFRGSRFNVRNLRPSKQFFPGGN